MLALYVSQLFFHIRRIAKIRDYLSEESTAVLVHAFVTCRLDYGNAFLYGLPDYLIQRLQAVQNCAARLVKRCPKYAHASPLLMELHWLPVEQRIIFKLLLLVFKSLNNLAPLYINELLYRYSPSRNLRSANQCLLVIHRSNQSTYGDRAFSAAASKLWNTLPISVRQSRTLSIFKRNVKTHLFRQAFL